MSAATDTGLTAITVEGGLLSTSVLSSLARRDGSLSHLGPESYEVDPGMSLGEAITRSWNRVLAAWQRFRREQEDRGSIGAGRTRQLLLQVLLEELRFGRPPRVGGVTVDGTHYAITHMWEHVPIHLLAPDVPLDRRTEGVAGAAKASPHTLVQEFLNASDEHLWGILSNGRKLRLLRDNRSITRTPYVEFDLEAVFDGELFSDFAVLWLLCHQSRFDAPEPGRAVIEAWRNQGIQSGERALSDLRHGVEEAISILGEGFLSHPANEALCRELRDGGLSAEEYYRELLRLVYRLIFLFVAEDRNVLLRPDADAAARRFYLEHYSTRRLRRLAEEIRGTHHADLFEQLKVVMRLLHRDGSEALALPALGSYLWSPEALGELDACRIENAAFLDAVRRLAFTEKGRMRWRTDFRSLGSEELGSVYESLLELRPEINTISHHFSLGTAAGNERKTTGSYYTPHVLVEKLLDTALDPVIDRAEGEENPTEAIRSLKVVDPATGSGHFLVAAAQRIGKRLAAVRTGEAEPAPEEVRRGVREAINHCIYGVDINPMAVELCKVSLWMEALEPGKPLSFLDHHIKVGNSLFGTTPELLDGGIPDDAFSVLTLDEKGAASAARKRNRQERTGERSLFNVAAAVREDLSATATRLARLNARAEENLADVEALSASYEEVLSSDAYRREKLTADAWCAAFVWPKRRGAPEVVTEEYFRRLAGGADALSADQRRTVEELASEYRFFHWHLAFPDVFLREDEDRQGFDCVLGNPPWDQVQFTEKEWFAPREPDIASAQTTAERQRRIKRLETTDPELYRLYERALRRVEAEKHFIGTSGVYALSNRGKLNVYALFTEHARDLVCGAGRAGMVVPTGLATDEGTSHFFADLVEARQLVSLFDFENKNIFPEVHSSYKFSLVTLSGATMPKDYETRFVFFAHEIADIDDPERQISLSREDFLRINPNTKTAPVLRYRRDAEIVRLIYARVPILLREDETDFSESWFDNSKPFKQGLFNMSSDSGLFRTRAQLEEDGYHLEGNVFRKEGAEEYLPLYEAKMIHIFDHRWAGHDGTEFRDVSEAQKRDPNFAPLPRYWVPASEVDTRLGGSGGRSGRGAWDRGWLMGWRDICRSTDERTTIASVVPTAGVGNNLPLMFPIAGEPFELTGLLTALSSYVLDFVARIKVGGTHMNYFYYKQLPIPAPAILVAPAAWDPAGPRLSEWIRPRVLELLYVSPELAAFAGDLDFDGPPFRWDPVRRFIIRCELDAAFFHLYGIEGDDVDYIMEQFPIVKRKDERTHGSYRTKETILRYYDRMAEAMDGGPPFESELEPAPGEPGAAIDTSTKRNLQS